jgi:hypothetical protein
MAEEPSVVVQDSRLDEDVAALLVDHAAGGVGAGGGAGGGVGGSTGV